MSSTNFRLELFRPWNPFQDKAQPLRDPAGTCRYPSPVSITATPPSSNSSGHGPKKQNILCHKPERHPLPARPPTEVCLDGQNSEVQTTRPESEGLGQTLSAMVPMTSLFPSFADDIYWEREREFLELGLDDSDPVDFARQHPQSVDLGIPTQNGELLNFENVDPAILDDHESLAEQAQTTMGIASIATPPEECPRGVHSLSEQGLLSPSPTEFKGDGGQ
ncbi:hypothetical protein HAV15_004792 [Penicillium sp. str. |nr:hypothetical protein HAV15_004792 [Penicillium sp. str. \